MSWYSGHGNPVSVPCQVMDKNTPLHMSHDIGIILQHKIEKIEEVAAAARQNFRICYSPLLHTSPKRCKTHIDYI